MCCSAGGVVITKMSRLTFLGSPCLSWWSWPASVPKVIATSGEPLSLVLLDFQLILESFVCGVFYYFFYRGCWAEYFLWCVLLGFSCAA